MSSLRLAAEMAFRCLGVSILLTTTMIVLSVFGVRISERMHRLVFLVAFVPIAIIGVVVAVAIIRWRPI